MDNQSVSWSERIQAAGGHLLILFFFIVCSVVMQIMPKTEPYFHSLGKFLPLDLLFESTINLSIKGWFFWIFVFNALFLSLLAKLVTSDFVKNHLQSARNFSLTCLTISLILFPALRGTGRGLKGFVETFMHELTTTTDPRIHSVEFNVGFYVILSIFISTYVLWYSQVIFAAINSLRGKTYEYFVTFFLKFRGRNTQKGA